MDRALLERMVGAAVLVLAFVVVAPMLLDGRDEDGPGVTGKDASSAGSRRTEVIVLNSPSQPKQAPNVKKSPESATPAKKKLAVAEVSKPAVSKPVAKKPAARLPVAPKPAPDRKESQAPSEGFAIQVGSFSSRDNAVGYAGSVREGGYPVFVVKGAAGSGAVYRVYVGPKDSRKEAEGLAARLAADGKSVLVVDLAGSAGG